MSQDNIFEALQVGLTQAKSVQTPGEVHGILTGMLCIDNEISGARAVEDVQSDTLDSALDALREMTLEGLFDPDLGFKPLLPDDEVELAQRVRSLGRWCDGFLYGLSNSGQFELDRLSPEIREVVSDLTELSRVGLSEDEAQSETAEADYAELVEYVRVGVQMIFLELQPKREGPTSRESLH
ncbi:UPF0149 family protein [Salinisphaera sp.]|uniref:UPF0149 family protein n=1 Tax=Salinisphaera sp. TaxID=1914330 RepID=UPI000C3F9D92|nr:UPF0149 family protein [Salinisphaera sp.]MAS11546.1 hypothetical protein [Salinisphaera sp.]|tara:strand:- start:129 stop:674 length:546 start_codon:yes stop_codon:yes gene_type:complete